MANYYKRDEFKDWLIREKVSNGLLKRDTANSYLSYVNNIYNGRDLTDKDRKNFSSAMEMYKEFLKTLP